MSQPTTDSSYYYYWWDNAVQAGETYTTGYGGASPTVYASDYIFDSRNQMSEADIHDGVPRTVAYTRDIDGAVLARDTEGVTNAPHERYTIFGGLQLGDVSNDGTSDVDYATSINRNTAAPAGSGFFQNGATTATSYADFDAAYDPINGQDAPGNIGRYTVQNGESLQSIALAIWGDANLWYVLAQANGLSADSDLAAGSDLVVPANVYGSSNSASTFRVYDPNRALGNISPTHPPRPQHHNNCGVFGQILLAVIAIVVTALTMNPLIAYMQGVLGSATAGAIAGGALAGAAGSVASQTVGLATGIQSSFNWGALGMAAIGGAVSGGLGPDAFSIGGLGDTANAVINGVADNMITQGIGVATGLQKSFNWADVAAAGVAAGVVQWVGDQFPQTFASMSPTMGRLTRGMVSDIAYAATRSLVNGSDFGDNMLQGLPNVLGNMISGAIGDEEYLRQKLEDHGTDVSPELQRYLDSAQQRALNAPIKLDMPYYSADDIQTSISNLQFDSTALSCADPSDAYMSDASASAGSAGAGKDGVETVVVTAPPLPAGAPAPEHHGILGTLAHLTLTGLSFIPGPVGSVFSFADGILYHIEGDDQAAEISFAAGVIGLFSDAGGAHAAGELALAGYRGARAAEVLTDADKIADAASKTRGVIELGNTGSHILNSDNVNDTSGGSTQGSISGPVDKASPHEQQIAQELAAEGHNVEFVPRQEGVKTPDMLVDGVITEVKELQKLGPNTLKNQIEEAAEQSAGNILIDGRKVGLAAKDVVPQVLRAQGNLGISLQGRVSVWTPTGKVWY